LCKNCYDVHLKKTNPDYRERQKLNTQNWIKTNVEKHRESQKSWRAKQDKKYLKEYKRMKKIQSYGITVEDFNTLNGAQGGACAICGKIPPNGRSLHIDHNHSTGKVRGLLCFRCNFGMSYFSEDIEMFEKVLKYLRSEFELKGD